MVSHAPARFAVDPLDPRAPPSEVWARMSDDERRRVVEALPSELPLDLMTPPEGDGHRKAKEMAVDALGRFFGETRRRVYVSAELPVYYPGEKMIAPDVLAVLDVETHDRNSWIVDAERKGLDFVLEVHVSGDARKDHVTNVERYARLGISEYFVFDRARGSLWGHRLAEPERRAYERVVPQLGRYPSRVLGLDLMLLDGKLRFLSGGAPLPLSTELIDRLGKVLDDAIHGKEELERQLAEERAAHEAAEAKLADALAEIARLTGKKT